MNNRFHRMASTPNDFEKLRGQAGRLRGHEQARMADFQAKAQELGRAEDRLQMHRTGLMLGGAVPLAGLIGYNNAKDK